MTVDAFLYVGDQDAESEDLLALLITDGGVVHVYEQSVAFTAFDDVRSMGGTTVTRVAATASYRMAWYWEELA